jgi:hypothetical protein
LSGGSLRKRDPRSDVTFSAGVFFYGLTGIEPSLLLDENRRMPHQRPDASEFLATKFAPGRRRRLLDIFDRAFDIDVGRRWQSAAELKSAMGRLTEDEPNLVNELDSLKQEVEQYRASSAAKISEANDKILRDALKELGRVTAKVQSGLGGSFDFIQTGLHIDPFKACATNSLAIRQKGNPGQEWVKFTIEIVGSELVVRAESNGQNEPLHRTSAEEPVFGIPFDKGVETAMLRQLRAELARNR